MPLKNYTTMTPREVAAGQAKLNRIRQASPILYEAMLRTHVIKVFPQLKALMMQSPEKVIDYIDSWADWVAKNPKVSLRDSKGKTHDFTGEEYFRLQMVHNGIDPDAAADIVGAHTLTAGAALLSTKIDSHHTNVEPALAPLKPNDKALKEGQDSWDRMQTITKLVDWQPGSDGRDDSEKVAIRPGDGDMKKDIIMSADALDQNFTIVADTPSDDTIRGDLERAFDQHSGGETATPATTTP